MHAEIAGKDATGISRTNGASAGRVMAPGMLANKLPQLVVVSWIRDNYLIEAAPWSWAFTTMLRNFMRLTGSGLDRAMAAATWFAAERSRRSKAAGRRAFSSVEFLTGRGYRTARPNMRQLSRSATRLSEAEQR